MGTKDQIKWRRDKIMEYMSHGYTNQSDLAQIMQIPLSTVNRDVMFLKQRAKDNFGRYEESLAFEYEKCLVEIISIQKEAWAISETSKYERNKIMAVSLAKDALSLKIDLLSNTDTMDRAIRFVKSKKQRLKELQEDEEEQEYQASRVPDRESDEAQQREEVAA